MGIKLRYADFRTVTRELTTESPTQDAGDIRRLAGRCLKRVDLQRRFRLLGIRVSSLERADAAHEAAPDANTQPPRQGELPF